VWDVLLACPRVGRSQARTICERAQVWPHTRLSELMKRERLALIRALPKRLQG
jgi:hypothetical protein